MGVELGHHSEVDVQLALNNVAECHVVREPKLISRLNKFSVTEIILVDYPAFQGGQNSILLTQRMEPFSSLKSWKHRILPLQ